MLLLTKNIVFNFSNYKPTTTEEFVLNHGLNFCLPLGNKSDHIFKMEKILYDTTKFKLIGPSCDFDNTTKVKSKIQSQLLQLKKMVYYHLVSTKLFDRPNYNNLVCMDYPRVTNKIYHYNRFYP